MKSPELCRKKLLSDRLFFWLKALSFFFILSTTVKTSLLNEVTNKTLRLTFLLNPQAVSTMHPIERLCSETRNQPLIRLTGTEAASVHGRRERK